MRLRIKLPLLILLVLLLKPNAKGQDSIRCGQWITANMHYGFIIPIYGPMDVLLKAHVPAIELNYVSKPSANLPWQLAYHSPETGVAFYYAWLGNPTQLGNMIGVYPFINFHMQKSYREDLYFRIGIGLAYMPVIFDRLNNHKNDVIGSHVDALLNVRFNSHIYLSSRTRLELGLGVTHASDGNYQAPNLGINVLTFNTGLSYCIKPGKYLPKPYKDSVSHADKIENNVYLAFGLSEREPPDQGKYGAVTLNYTRYYKLSTKSKLGGGIDVFYNQTNIVRMADNGIYLKNSLENIQSGLKVCYEVTVGKFALPYELGAYTYTMYKGSEIYDRIGVRYYANRHTIINLTLLLHYASADYIEWGMGYRF